MLLVFTVRVQREGGKPWPLVLHVCDVARCGQTRIRCRRKTWWLVGVLAGGCTLAGGWLVCRQLGLYASTDKRRRWWWLVGLPVRGLGRM